MSIYQKLVYDQLLVSAYVMVHPVCSASVYCDSLWRIRLNVVGQFVGLIRAESVIVHPTFIPELFGTLMYPFIPSKVYAPFHLPVLIVTHP